ncbi:peptidylprolyl isomerase [Colwelliaceae bacterium 6471]
MKYFNAADNDLALDDINNPAVNHGDFSEANQELMEAERLKLLPPEVPEITVNGVLIEETSVLEEMQHHPADSKRAAMVKTVESLIVGELLKQKAIKLGLLENEVKAHSVEEAAGLKKLIQQEVAVPKASEHECQRFFEQNQGKFTTSPLLEVRHILLAAAPDDIEERHKLKEAADKLIAILKETPSAFDDLVTRHSACPSKETQGNLGQISKDQTVPEFERHIFAADEGLIEYPVETRYGFHVVMVDRKIAGKALPYDYVKEKVADYLNDKVERKATAQYIQTLICEANIKGFTFDLEESPLIQ